MCRVEEVWDEADGFACRVFAGTCNGSNVGGVYAGESFSSSNHVTPLTPYPTRRKTSFVHFP